MMADNHHPWLALALCMFLGACGGADNKSIVEALPQTTAVAAATATLKKWNPGHWLWTNTSAGRVADQGAGAQTLYFNYINDESQFKGYSVMFWWANVEVDRDVYDFTLIQQMRDAAASRGKKLIIQFMWQSAGGPPDDVLEFDTRVLPAYLDTDEFGYAQHKYGITAKMWEQPTMDRAIKLMQALAAEFDDDPVIEGFVLGLEWAMTFPITGTPDSFNNDDYRDQIIRFVDAATAAWVHTNVFNTASWLGDAIEHLKPTIDECRIKGCGSGAYDVVEARNCDGDRIRRGELGGHDYRGEIPIIMKWGDTTYDIGSAQDGYDYAVGKQKTTHMVWQYIGDTSYTEVTDDQKFATGVLPVTRAHPTTNTACPSVYADRCVETIPACTVGDAIACCDASDCSGGASCTENVCMAATTRLVAHYSMDSIADTEVADDSGNGHDAVIEGAPTVVAGVHGSALAFDGVDDFLDTGITTHLPRWSIAVWVRGEQAPGSVFDSGPVAYQENLNVFWDHRTSEFRGAAGFSDGTWRASSFGELAGRRWYHLAATYDGESLRAYKDGELVATNTTSQNDAATATASLKIARHAIESWFFAGVIDEVRVYDGAVDEPTIAELAAGCAAPTSADCGGDDPSSGTSESEDEAQTQDTTATGNDSASTSDYTATTSCSTMTPDLGGYLALTLLAPLLRRRVRGCTDSDPSGRKAGKPQ